MKNHRTRKLSQRVRYALLAGMAGTFLIPQAAFAGPTGEHGVASNINIQRPDAVTTTITSTALNNVINWQDYSVKQGELVQYDGGAKTNNYLNIVTGANTSNINGKIEGGNNVYIVNPNGVIFGKSAEVNVGNLYVSTQDTGTLNRAAFEASGTSPLDTTAALKADVVNMGKINATSVEVHGSHIRFLNAADVTATNPVVLHTETAANSGYAHIGYESGHSPAAADYQINGANAVAADNYYQLVATKADLDNINTTNLAGNYMLASDIDFANAAHTPIGGNDYGAFTGKFDGNFFQIQNINVSGVDNAGFFGVLRGARIHNLGVVGGTVASNTGTGNRYAGGIVGDSSYSMLQNVYVKGTRVNGRQMMHAGLAGHTASTTIDGSYSKALVGSNGAGVVGIVDANTTITNTYNEAVFSAAPENFALFFGGVNGVGTTRVENSYTKSATIATNDNVIRSKFKNVFAVNSATGKMNRLSSPQMPDMNAYAAGSYTGWDINNTGEPGAKWRIYEGRTLPMLTAFMNGRVDSTGSVGVEYKYRKFNQDGTPVADSSAVSNNHADIPTGKLTYDSKIIKIVDGDGNIGGKGNVGYDKTLSDAQKNLIFAYEDASPTSLDRDKNIRNAGTKAMLWSDQDGPNLRGVNVTIDKRKIDVQDSSFVVTRMYDGTKDITEAFKKALSGGGLKATGFTDEDLNDPDSARKITITPSSDFTATLDNKSVADNKPVTFTGSITFAGTNKDNYDVGSFNFTANPGIKGWASVTKAPLILNVIKDTASKVYDGTDAVNAAGMDAATNAAINEALTLMVDGNTVTANVKTDADTGNKDDVALEDISNPTYVDASGNAQIHAGNNQIIRYKNVKLKGADKDNYELYYKLPSGTPTKLTDDKIDLKGDIYRRQIKVDNFKVYDKGTHAGADATKVYNGNENYTLDTSTVYLSSNQADTTDTTGIVERDRGYITFALTGNTAKFKKSDGTTDTKNVATAEKIAYNVKAQADGTHVDAIYGEHHLLSDYWVFTDRDNALTDAATFDAQGKGTITPKTITAAVKGNITKVYDALSAHNETGDNIVQLNGIESGDTVTNESTADYGTKNVAYSGGTPTTKTVTYTAKFSIANADEAQNYTFSAQATPATSTPVTKTKNLTGLGTITPRSVVFKFKSADKIYDGTTTNTKIAVDSYDDGENGGIITRDFGASGPTLPSTITSTYNTKHAGDNKTVTYTGLANALGGNYTVADTQTGTGKIERRLIKNSGFQVLRNGVRADAEKVYDGTDVFTLKSDEKLVAENAAPATDTGIVADDEGKIHFKIAGAQGHFIKGTSAADTTSHVSEADHIAYNVIAKSDDETNSPLSNYYFGTSYTDKRNLEAVNGTDPKDAVTAAGRITPASIQAVTKEITKVYDGMAEHTDGNRTIQHGSGIVDLALINDASGQPVNTSTASYADKNVARDMSGNIIKKSVNYTAQLTGKYADDYQIVDAGNHVISTASGSGDNKTVTAALGSVADAGTITPRKLNITMGETSKRYDRSAANNSASVAQITGTQGDIAVNNTILGADGVTAGDLQAEYRTQLTGDPTLSSYGRGTGAAFAENVNASNGTKHDVQYKKMKTAFDNKFSAVKDNYEVDETVYGKGTITRKEINGATFKVSGGKATKVYDGTSKYTVAPGRTLEADTGEIIAGDVITFAIDHTKGANFTQNDGVTETKNVADARKVAYHVTAAGNAETLRNYTLNGKNLEAGDLAASGDGEITRRVLSLDLVQKTGIDKEYDRETTLRDTDTKHWNKLTDNDSLGNVKYADGSTAKDKLVANDGTSFAITSSYRNDANTSEDKKVKYNGTAVDDKKIQYNIAITGGDVNNYSFDGTTSAASGLKLSATGKITPKDLSGAFDKVTKEYDGTTNVPSLRVRFKTGAVIAGDTVSLATHNEVFQSANVNGDGTTLMIDGSVQKNWVNYTNLSLTGTDAGNYHLNATAKGQGEITPFRLNGSSVHFTTNQAEKVYDGTMAVKHGDSTDLGVLKTNYITGATVTVGSAPPVNILGDLNLVEAKYDTKDVDGGRAANRVTYKLSYTDTSGTGNFSLAQGADSFETHGNGIITKKDVTATVRSSLTKTYDASQDVVGVAKDSAGNVVTNANELIQLTGLTGNDGAFYTTTAAYAGKNVRTGESVNYTLHIDPANAGNYNLKYRGTDNNGTFSTANNTIEKRTVKVNFADVSKEYDGSAANATINPFVSAADAAVLNRDHTNIADSSNKLTNLGGLTSNYGKMENGVFRSDPNAGTKTVRYEGLRTAMNNTLGTEASNYAFDEDGYGNGTIGRKAINPGTFNISGGIAEKIYDGTSKYDNIPFGAISPGAGELVGADAPHIHFALDTRPGKGARFTKADGKTETANAFEAERVAYDLTATTDAGHRNLLRNYTLNGMNLEDGGSATGLGKIKRRTLELNLVQSSGIDKVYDGGAALKGGAKNWNALTDIDANGNVKYADGSTADKKLVTTDGTRFDIKSNYLDDGNARADKNVRRDPFNNVIDKTIRYEIGIMGGNARNYSLKNGAVTVNAEDGLTLSAAGKITPKDLSGSFRKITKVYDGTTDVDPAAVGFEFGAVAADDDLTLATHTESFQSPEIDGDGTTAVINGTPQKNWINYSNLTLNGADAGNYTLASAAKGLGEIRSPRPAYYTPDAEYYKELTQTSRMIPNEYAYENASMDQSGHFGRDAEAEVAYRTPSVNMTMDGMDLSKSDILVTDRAVFAIVSEVFG
ncbi:YDG domain-containing protein [Selenomonas noxia]|uniref:YDG domain-containing protein n=2 Tax=Selenomonas noxia TaxID=135083 RepID=UPI00288999B1|nr:YDG domain-containing protein [Selenomonas noxia]